MNHLDTEEQVRVLEHPEDFSESTRDDVADQQADSATQPVSRGVETFSLRDAAQGLSSLVRRAKAGETLVITVRREPVAQLGPIQHPAITAGGEND